MAKTLNARIQNKHDVEVNWIKATGFTPMAGEIIIYDPDETHAAARFKIGDGETLVNNLPFVGEELAAAFESERQARVAGDVQSDWNTASSSSLAYILNKPDIKKDGCKGYEIYRVYADPDKDNKKCIAVAPAIPSTDWAVGDRISFDIGGTYTYGFTISELVHKSKYTLIHVNEVLPDKTAADDETMYVWNLDKTQSGNVDVGIGALAQGIDTAAIGKGSVALNRQTKAEGNFSFAANRGTIAGYGAASFGKSTEARGTHSFTNGQGTIATTDYQCVQGKFNIPDEDNPLAPKDSNGEIVGFAHVVGNGTKLSKPSNAYTLDWDGNGWFAGNVTIGTNKDVLATQAWVKENTNSSVTIDSVLSTTSTNPAQNKVITAKLNEIDNKVNVCATEEYVDNSISTIEELLNMTIDDIDTICESSIAAATLSEVTF